jgi:hypothetical protein
MAERGRPAVRIDLSDYERDTLGALGAAPLFFPSACPAGANSPRQCRQPHRPPGEDCGPRVVHPGHRRARSLAVTPADMGPVT